MTSPVATAPFKTLPGQWQIRLATTDDRAIILDLQEQVIANLSPQHRTFVFRRQRDHIDHILDFGGHILLGESEQGVFASMLMADVATVPGYLRALDMDAQAYTAPSLAQPGVVMQSLLVNPAFHGQGIAQHMFAAALDVAQHSGAGFVSMAENRANKPAIAAAFKNGFSIGGFGTHSTFGVAGYIFNKDITAAAGVIPAVMPVDDVQAIEDLVLALLADGNIITSIDFSNGAVAYQARSARHGRAA